MLKENSVIFVTGASDGIGRELASQLSEKPYRIAAFARSKGKLADLESRVLKKSGVARVAGYICDVSDRSAVQASFLKAQEELGVPDLLIANAGIGRSFSARRFEIETVEQIHKTNVLGAIYCIEAVLPGMLERRSGHIAGISSLAAYRSFPFNHTYCASKAALSAHLEGLRIELRKHGIKVSTICPGFIKTSMTDKNKHNMPFIMDVGKAAGLIIRAIEKDKKVYNFPWQTMLLARASRLLPDKLVSRMNS